MKRMAIYGDSISTVNHGNGGYETIIKEGLGLEIIYNFSVGSSGLTEATPKGMLELLRQKPVPKDVDLVLVWHGSNDWYWGSHMGSFAAGIKEAVERIRRDVPEATIVWLTPMFRFEMPDQGAVPGEAYQLENKAGHTLLDYYVQLELSSKQLGFYLLDMRRLLNIHKENMDVYLEDQVHPNNKGYEKIGAVIISELERFL